MKRTICLFLVFCMVVATFPTTVLATTQSENATLGVTKQNAYIEAIENMLNNIWAAILTVSS